MACPPLMVMKPGSSSAATPGSSLSATSRMNDEGGCSDNTCAQSVLGSRNRPGIANDTRSAVLSDHLATRCLFCTSDSSIVWNNTGLLGSISNPNASITWVSKSDIHPLLHCLHTNRAQRVFARCLRDVVVPEPSWKCPAWISMPAPSSGETRRKTHCGITCSKLSARFVQKRQIFMTSSANSSARCRQPLPEASSMSLLLGFIKPQPSHCNTVIRPHRNPIATPTSPRANSQG